MPGPLRPGRSSEELVEEVRGALADLPAGAVTLVAVSGGPDSVSLLHLAARARGDLRLHVGHVRHGLRDDSRDVAVVRAHATRLDLPLHVVAVEVGTEGGPEAAARDARYAALGHIAGEIGADRLLVGHTADDQAETVLLRVARGTGLDGLVGMQVEGPAPPTARTGRPALRVARPLLRVRRSDLRDLVAAEGLVTVQDPSNRDRSLGRVRVRLDVLPALGGVAADPVAALARLADLARDDVAALDAATAAVTGAVVRRYGPARAIRLDDVRSLDAALARRVVRRMLAEVRGDRPPLASGHVESVLGAHPGEALDVPGATVSCGGGWLAVAPVPGPPPEPRRLAVPGRTRWPPAGVEIEGTVSGPGADPEQHGADEADGGRDAAVDGRSGAVPPGGRPALTRVALPSGREPLVVRTRRAGDRVRLGAVTRKLQDVLVDSGVPRVLRDLLPVVTVGDRVVWIPGVVAEPQEDPSAPTGAAVRLRAVGTDRGGGPPPGHVT